MNNKYRLLLHSILLFLFTPNVIATLPSQQILNQASRSVVKVQAQNCSDQGSRSASGFVWQRANQIVTALHVVAGCERITVYSEANKKTRAAKVKRILRKADLALLEINNPIDLVPLKINRVKPALHDDLIALGYELGAPTMSSKNLKISFGSSLLSDMLPDKVRREIQRGGTPSLSLKIMRLQGHLVPGLSGAPLLNSQGEVVAIADGGLENGAASISWALPVENVDDLLISSERVTTTIIASSSHFAASLQATRGQEVMCNDMTFTQLRTRRYSDIASSTDDPVGLAQLQQMADLIGFDIDGLMFDIYVHLDTGATLAIPEGMALQPAGRTCIAQKFNRALELRVAGNLVSSPFMANQASLDFENAIVSLTRLEWVPDPVWSYSMPQQRFDGFIANRKSFYGYNPLDSGYMYGQALPTAYGFETLMARSNSFVGIAALNHNYEDLLPQSLMLCEMNQNHPTCERIIQQLPSWIAMILGVFLSTFPIG